MSNPTALDHLAQRFNIDGLIRIENGSGGLPRLAITAPAAEAHVYLHGAHVTHYQPRGQRPVLFMSQRSAFDETKPIRGGVPICLPWFAVKEDDPGAPMHGFARTFGWTIEATGRVGADAAAVTLAFRGPPESMRKFFPHDFTARFTATVGETLAMELAVTNAGSAPMTFTEALHTYFSVGDVRQARVSGLEGVEYYDKVRNAPARQGDGPVTFTGETDRVYFNTKSTCTIDDPVFARRITVEKTGSGSTVVWNPWIDRAKALPDFGDDEWPTMVCIETANTKYNAATTLQPGATHTMRQVVRATAR